MEQNANTGKNFAAIPNSIAKKFDSTELFKVAEAE